MNTDFLVPDANIMIAYLTDEREESEWVVAFIEKILNGRISAKVPSLWSYEICNRLCRLNDEDRKETHQLFVKLDRFFPVQELRQEVIEHAYGITSQYNVAFYDAVYHALAMVEGIPFITLDQKYYEKTKSLKHIRLLRDYS